MILIPFLDIAAVLPHFVSLVPEDGGRWGRRWEKTNFAFEYQICLILQNFATIYDFDTFSRYRVCIALMTFHSSPVLGVEDGRRLCV